MKVFAVCINEEYIRDAQVLNYGAFAQLPDDTDMHDTLAERCWDDSDVQGFIGIYAAEDAHDALCCASAESGHDTNILRAIDVTGKIHAGDTGKHWVVYEEWCVDYENGSKIVAVCHSEEEAKQAFAAHREDFSRPDAERNHYAITTDIDDEFDAGKEGYYAQDHIYLRIIETNVKSEPVELRIRQVSANICDLFESLLASHGIYVPSDDRTGDESESCIYGEPYSQLEDGVTDILATLLQTLPSSFIVNAEEY